MRAMVLAEFLSPEELIRAIRELRALGYRRLDAFTPYPVKGAAEALGLGRSMLNWLVFGLGMSGAAAAYLIQWYCNAYDYPINVGGRPLHAAPAFIPITFEMGVLAAAVGGLCLYFIASGLPELWNPIFDVPGFERASIDRFWVSLYPRDPSFDPADVERDLKELGAIRVAFTEGRR
jgi:hypothetical protein